MPITNTQLIAIVTVAVSTRESTPEDQADYALPTDVERQLCALEDQTGYALPTDVERQPCAESLSSRFEGLIDSHFVIAVIVFIHSLFNPVELPALLHISG